ncbi:MAG: hypothetical protein RLZZ244_576 [Verrucomicrobiota bacterium]|jgi:hypothetical protein
MSRMLPFLLARYAWVAFGFCVVTLSGKAQDPAAESAWRDRALAEYPDLAVKDSALNRRFIFMVKVLRESAPKIFADPTWPLRLAKLADTRDWPAEVKSVPRDPDWTKRLYAYCEAALKEGLRRGEVVGDLKRFTLPDGTLRSSAYGELLDLSERYIPDTEEALERFVRTLGLGEPKLNEEEEHWLALVLSKTNWIKWLEDSELESLKLVVELLARLGDTGEVLAWMEGGKSHYVNGAQVSYAAVPVELRHKALELLVRQRLQLGDLHFGVDPVLEAAVTLEHWSVLYEASFEHWPARLWDATHAPMQFVSPVHSDEWREYFTSLDALYHEMSMPKADGVRPPPAPKAATPGRLHYGVGNLEECLMWRCLRFESPSDAAAWLNKMAQGLATVPDQKQKDARRVFAAMSLYFKGTWKTALGIKK